MLKIKLLSGQFLKTPPYKSFSIMIIHIWPLKCLSDWCHSRLKLSVKKGQLKAKAMPAIAVFTVGKLLNCPGPKYIIKMNLNFAKHIFAEFCILQVDSLVLGNYFRNSKFYRNLKLSLGTSKNISTRKPKISGNTWHT